MFKAVKKKWGPEICSWVPLEFWHRLLGVELLLPYYHMVSDQDLAHVSGLYRYRNVRQFNADLEFFLKSYAPVGLQDVLDCLDGARRLPRRCFLMTFDDGFREVHDVVAPILRARGVPAVFFLTTSVVDNRELCFQQKISLLCHKLDKLEGQSVKREAALILDGAGVKGSGLGSRIRGITYTQRHVLDELGPVLDCDFAGYVASTQPYLTSAQIKNLMRRGFAIGAHSIDHPLYSELSLDEQLFQTRESLDWLSNQFQYDCEAFAFPFRDACISPEFFQSAFSGGRLKVSFGTSGLHRHYFPRNLTRNTMENNPLPAKQILSREFGVTLLRRPPWERL